MMIPTYYTGKENARPPQPLVIDTVTREEDPANYVADEQLAAAVNVCLILGKPLLLTGDPGTGKTRLAEHVAMALGLDAPERFDTKSTSQANDLFYRFDNLARFQSANAREGDRRAMDFVTFGPLGKAFLRSLGRQHPVFNVLSFPYPGGPDPARSVVLIDEIDKAPRDFPNDLLDAIDNNRFTIRELERDVTARLTQACGSSEITAAHEFRPVVIITSNSEKNLPDPFLRRCVYFHVEFPSAEQLLAIVARRTGGGDLADAEMPHQGRLAVEEASPLLRSSVALFAGLRNAGVRKQPSTAELIDWVRYLLATGATPALSISRLPKDLVRQSLGVLVKSMEDLTVAYKFVDDKLAGFDGRLG